MTNQPILFSSSSDFSDTTLEKYLKEIGQSLSLSAPVTIIDEQSLSSCFSVSELAAATFAAVGSSIASLLLETDLCQSLPKVQVDQRLASIWFHQSIYPIGWKLPPVWDSIAGDYQTADGWIKLHTNLAHHRDAVLKVLDVARNRNDVATALLRYNSNELEFEVVEHGGVAAVMRSRQEWQNHPQGLAVMSEPLVKWGESRKGNVSFSPSSTKAPLKGLRVLDLTRVLAGPVATRTLAGFGADVLRIDPPDWDEPFVVPDISLGKRCAMLDLNAPNDRQTFEDLLTNADVLVHGYRPGALDNLGFGEAARLALSPTLIEVSLDAYGWTGPWASRRGFDSLVQMSGGIAEAGMHWVGSDEPTPLPVQALDHATGYLMAAAVIKSLLMACRGEGITSAHLSLARTAELLIQHQQEDKPQSSQPHLSLLPLAKDFKQFTENTPWGPANRLRSALSIEGTSMEWACAANNLGTSIASWQE